MKTKQILILAIQFRILCTCNLVKHMKNENKADSDPGHSILYSMYLKAGKIPPEQKVEFIPMGVLHPFFILQHYFEYTPLSNQCSHLCSISYWLTMADHIITRVLDGDAIGDHYQVLGVYPEGYNGKAATAEEAIREFRVVSSLPVSSIKSAYRATSLYVHPDKCKHDMAGEAQVKVNNSWDVLSVPTARAEFHQKYRMKLRTAQEQEKLVVKAAVPKPEYPWIKQQEKVDAEAKSKATKSCTKQAATDGKASKESHSSKDTSTNPEPDHQGCWEIGGIQLKEFKQHVTAKLSHMVVRKFLCSEWQDKQVTRKVASEFATKAKQILLKFDCTKLKHEKLDVMKELGITMKAMRFSITDMRDVLEQVQGLGQQSTHVL